MIQLDAIQDARSRISGHILSTPLVHSRRSQRFCGIPVGLKLEHYQTTKQLRVARSDQCDPQAHRTRAGKRPVAASTGNHGRALCSCSPGGCDDLLVTARAGNQALGNSAPRRGRAANWRLAMRRAAVVDRLVAENGLVILPSFDHPAIVTGQGTIALDIVEAIPDVVTPARTPLRRRAGSSVQGRAGRARKLWGLVWNAARR